MAECWPSHSGWLKTSPTPSHCRNCDTPLQGSFCHQCGQRDVNLERPIYLLLGDSLREALDIDGRIACTLWSLMARPGQVTAGYLAGKRQQYTPPLRLYLVISLLFFLFVAWLVQQGFLFELNDSTTDEVYVLAEQLPKLMFICLPLFALLLKLLHPSRLLFDHLIHALHLHAAAYIALGFLLPFEQLANASPVLLAIQIGVFGYMIVYLAVSQHRVYASTWPVAALKTGVLFFAYTVVLGSLLELANAIEAAGGFRALLRSSA